MRSLQRWVLCGEFCLRGVPKFSEIVVAKLKMAGYYVSGDPSEFLAGQVGDAEMYHRSKDIYDTSLHLKFF